MNEKDMIARYIYEVTKRVPQETQQEISLELQSLIEDMCISYKKLYLLEKRKTFLTEFRKESRDSSLA